MALIKCPECAKEVSTAATTCPNCGYPLKRDDEDSGPQKPIEYEQMVDTIACWTRSGLEEKIEEFQSQGWEVVTMTENVWRSGSIRKVYNVVFRRPKL